MERRFRLRLGSWRIAVRFEARTTALGSSSANVEEGEAKSQRRLKEESNRFWFDLSSLIDVGKEMRTHEAKSPFKRAAIALRSTPATSTPSPSSLVPVALSSDSSLASSPPSIKSSSPPFDSSPSKDPMMVQSMFAEPS